MDDLGLWLFLLALGGAAAIAVQVNPIVGYARSRLIVVIVSAVVVGAFLVAVAIYADPLTPASGTLGNTG